MTADAPQALHEAAAGRARAELSQRRITALFDSEVQIETSGINVEAGGSWSRFLQTLTRRPRLAEPARAGQLPERFQKLFLALVAGQIVNTSERRPALHTLLARHSSRADILKIQLPFVTP